MTDEAKEQAPQDAQVQDTSIKPEDIKSYADMRGVLVQAEQGLLSWAQRKIQETNYVQAVQTELAMHKGDAHGFVLHRLIDFAEKQEARITVLEDLLAKAIGAAKKGK